MAKLFNRFEYAESSMSSQRSTFGEPTGRKVTFKAGKYMPFVRKEVYPGDTFVVNTSMVVRQVNVNNPTMDNAFADVYWFWSPNRLVWSHWKEFLGENSKGYWAPSTDYHIPKILFHGAKCTPDIEYSSNYGNWKFATSIFTGLGYPAPYRLKLDENGDPVTPHEWVTFDYKANALPARSAILIWNEYFRDENSMAPIDLYTGDNDVDLHYTDSMLTKFPSELPVCRFKDYFYSLLPSPQRGESIKLPLGDKAPVYTGENHTGTDIPLRFDGLPDGGASANSYSLNIAGTGMVNQQEMYAKASEGGILPTFTNNLHPNNLWVNLQDSSAITVNRLREVIATQIYQEQLARGGGRYREIIKSEWNVTIADTTAQVPEYLGGKRVPINMTTVLQTSAGTGGDTGTGLLGNTGAFSNTSDNDFSFVKSFDEHGYVIGIICVRPSNSYGEGLDRDLSYDNNFDYYHKPFARIGEQPVLKKELILSGNQHDDEVLGYQEPFAHLRSGSTTLAGYFLPSSGDTILNTWTYHHNYGIDPVLNDEFMTSDSDDIAKTLAYPDAPYHYFADILVDFRITREMPINGTPSTMGLLRA